MSPGLFSSPGNWYCSTCAGRRRPTASSAEPVIHNEPSLEKARSLGQAPGGSSGSLDPSRRLGSGLARTARRSGAHDQHRNEADVVPPPHAGLLTQIGSYLGNPAGRVAALAEPGKTARGCRRWCASSNRRDRCRAWR